MKNGKEIYIDEIIQQITRILTVLDRSEQSPTFGCFYRVFWHDKATDIPCAHPQIGALSLALLYKHNFPGNIYFRNEKIKKWCIGGMKFWQEIQNPDGSFNEHYPNEHSFGATAWTLSSVLDAYLLLQNEIPKKEREKILNAAIKASKWLMRNDDPGPLTNHIAIASLALYNMFKITHERNFLKGSLKKIQDTLEKQSSEGWFQEYGGVDLGYLTTTISFLARYYIETKNKEVFDSLKKAITFSSYFIYPDCFYGGFIGSRNTDHFYPLGFQIMNRKLPIANVISIKALEGIRNGNILTPKTMDDKHFFHLFNEFLQSYLNFSFDYKTKQKLPCESKPFKKYFEDARLLIVKEPFYYAVIGLNKGGILKIFDVKKSKSILTDGGIHGLTNDGKTISSQSLDEKYFIKMEDGKLSVNGNFHKIRSENLSSIKMIISRLVFLTLGRSNKISLIIKKGLIRRLITKSILVPFKFSRELNFEPEKIQIKDTVEGKGLKSINIGGELFPRYVPASKYFLKNNLEIINVWQNELAEKLNKNGKIIIKRSINFGV